MGTAAGDPRSRTASLCASAASLYTSAASLYTTTASAGLYTATASTLLSATRVACTYTRATFGTSAGGAGNAHHADVRAPTKRDSPGILAGAVRAHSKPAQAYYTIACSRPGPTPMKVTGTFNRPSICAT